MDTGPVQVFIKNEQGKVWGPLALSTIELLLDNGLVKGRVMVSSDGVNYALPGRFPELRGAFPRALWGVDVPPGEEPSPELAAPATLVALGEDEPSPSGSRPAAPGGAAPRAGPGTAAGFTAGPGARAAGQTRSQGARISGGHSAPQGARGSGIHQAPQGAPAAAPPAGPPVITPVVPVAAAAKKPAPPPPEEDTASLPSSGDLAECSAVKAYSLAAGAEATVLVTFKLSDREIQLHFRKGNPEHVASTHPEDALTAFLVKTDLAKPEQIAQAEAQKNRFGGELLGALFGTGALNPGTAFTQLIERAKSLLARAFLAPSGSFTTEPRDLPSHRSMPLGHKWAVLTELVRRIPTPELKRRLQATWELPAMKSGGRIPTSDLRLTPQETRALSHVDGVRSLAQFQKDLPQEYETVLRVVFLLNELDGISFAAIPSRRAPAPETPPPAPAAKPSGTAPRPPPGRPPTASRPVAPVSPPKLTAAPASPPSPPVRASAPTPAPAPPPVETVEQLRALASKLKGQNHFEVLGIDQKADASQVKVAYFKMAKQHHPDTVAEGSPPEFGKLKEEIFARVGEAYRTLSDDKLRAEYIEDLKHGGGEQIDVQQILLAEELFQKGCILVKARKWPEAVKMLDDAIKANAEEPEFYAWRGYAKFFANADRKAGQAEAARDIGLTLKKNERIGAAHYFLGHISKLMGDEKAALREFKRTVELSPDHIDAAREIRLMTGGKR